MALAAMPSGRPSDSDPEAWFRLAVQLDQNQAADEAFYGQVPTLASPPPPTAPSTPSPALLEVNPHFDARQMSSEELRKTLEGKLVIRRLLEDKEFHAPRRVARAASQLTRAAPQLCDSNRFSVLDVPEPEVFPECEEEAPESPEAQPQLPPEPHPRRPKWERRVGRKLVICSLEEGPKCIMLTIHLKTTDTMKEASMEAMVDTGTTGDFVD